MTYECPVCENRHTIDLPVKTKYPHSDEPRTMSFPCPLCRKEQVYSSVAGSWGDAPPEVPHKSSSLEPVDLLEPIDPSHIPIIPMDELTAESTVIYESSRQNIAEIATNLEIPIYQLESAMRSEDAINAFEAKMRRDIAKMLPLSFTVRTGPSIDAYIVTAKARVSTPSRRGESPTLAGAIKCDTPLDRMAPGLPGEAGTPYDRDPFDPETDWTGEPASVFTDPIEPLSDELKEIIGILEPKGAKK